MASVWYIGTADIRIITDTDWLAAGTSGPTVQWDSGNGWSAPRSAFSAAQLGVLNLLNEFNIMADDGPRTASILSSVSGNVVKGSVPPGDLSAVWIDTSDWPGPAVLRLWNGTMWADETSAPPSDTTKVTIVETTPSGATPILQRQVAGDPYPWLRWSRDQMFVGDGQTNPDTLSGDEANARMIFMNKGATGNILALLAAAGTDPTPHALLSMRDKNGLSLMRGMSDGILSVYDRLKTLKSGTSAEGGSIDPYGFLTLNGSTMRRAAGPPGNALSWATATGEAFDGDRAGSVGDWTSPSSVTTITSVLNPYGGLAPLTGLEHVLKFVQATGSAFNVQTGQTPSTNTPCVQGNFVRAMVSMRSGGTTRSLTPRLLWLDAGGSVVDQIDGTPVSVTAGTWATLTIGVTVPAALNIAGCALVVVGSSVATNETHYAQAAGIWVNNSPSGASDPNAGSVWSAPFVGNLNTTGSAFGYARTGDKHDRTDTPGVDGQQTYLLDGAFGGAYSPRQVGAPGSTVAPRWYALPAPGVGGGGGGGGTAADQTTIAHISKNGSFTLDKSMAGRVVEVTGTSAVATISQVGTTTVITGNGASGSTQTYTATAPAGVTTGDVMVVGIINQTASSSIVGPAGWSTIDSGSISGNPSATTYYRVATAADVGGSTTYVFTLGAGRYQGAINAWRGVDNAVPIEAHAVSTVTTASANAPLPAVTTTSVGAQLVGFVFGRTVAFVNTNTFTPPSGWTEQGDASSTSTTGSNATIEVITKVQATPGSTGSPVAVATQSSTFVNFMIALKPAQTGSGPASVTIPRESVVDWDDDTIIELFRAADGDLGVVAGTGVTIQTPASQSARVKYSSIGLRYRGNDVWALSGDLT